VLLQQQLKLQAQQQQHGLAVVRNVSRLLGTEGFRGAADALVRSLKTRIASTPLDVGAASRVATVVGETSPHRPSCPCMLSLRALPLWYAMAISTPRTAGILHV